MSSNTEPRLTMLATTTVDDHTPTLGQGNFFSETVDDGWTWLTAENTTTGLDRASTDASSTVWIVLLSVAAGIMSLVTVGGNLIVALSFALERSIRQPSNYFIASLAVSDFLIGAVSMPLYSVYVFTDKTWLFGELLCDLWLSLDYTACLCSIYTVFCITVDRFCSIRMPARYRAWRTERKVLCAIVMTWSVPVAVFFTSIIGWQYFVGYRSVPVGKCYVQYMHDALFNCILQVGYFWITLTTMILLYTGIYQVALQLHRRSKEKRLQNVTCLAQMAQRAVAGHIAGIVQERQSAATNVPVADHDDHPTADRPASAENPVRIEETVLPPPKSAQKARDITDSRRVQVPVELKISPQSVAVNYNTSPTFPSPGSTLNIRCRPSASSGVDHLDVGDEFMVNLSGLSSDPVNEGQGRRRHQSNDEKLFPAKILVSRASTATGLTLSASSMNGRRCSATGPNVGLKRSPKLLSINELLSGETSTEILQRPLSTNQTPSSDVDEDRLSDSDNCSDVWVPRTPTAAEQVSGIWIVCDQVPTADSLRSARPPRRRVHRARGRRAEREQPDTVFRRRVASGGAYPTEWYRTGAPNIGGRSLSGNADISTTVRDGRRTRQAAAAKRKIRQSDVDLTSSTQRDSTSGFCPSASLQRFAAPPTRIGHSLDIDAGADDGQESPVVQQLTVDGIPTADGADDQQQQTQDGRNVEHSRQQLMHVPVTAISTTTAALASSFLEKLASFRHGRSSMHDERHKQQKLIENRARKALRTISIILGAFIICWTPWHVLSLIIGFCGDDTCVSDLLYDISYWLCYLNSPLNPFCYALANHQFKKTFLRILKFDWRRN